MARRLPLRRDMRTLALLFVLLGLAPLPAYAQEADAPEGAIIDSVEMSGFSPYRLSPGLQKDIELARRIAAQPRATQRAGLSHRRRAARDGRGGARPWPDPTAKLTSSSSSPESATTPISPRTSTPATSSRAWRSRAHPTRSVSSFATTCRSSLADVSTRTKPNGCRSVWRASCPDATSPGGFRKGSESGRIRVVFEIFETPWIRFAPTRSKLVYHAQQGWSGVLDIPMSSSRSRHRFTAGIAFNDIDDLIEEYSGFRLAFESR